MLHVRIVLPPEHTATVVDLLTADPAVCDVLHVPSAGAPHAAELVICDVARARASGLIGEVRALGLGPAVSISMIEIAAMVSDSATQAIHAAGGRPTDSVVWEEVEERTEQRAGLSSTFLVLMLISTLIAAVGILQDSQVLIVGAMIVGPDFGPLAGLCVTLAERRPRVAARSGTALLIGFTLAVAAAALLTLVVRSFDAGPLSLDGQSHPFTRFISHPDWSSVLVAVLAGIGGIVTLTQSRSGALIGILVSVTTIPAVANVAVALAYGDGRHGAGALLQLLVNVVSFVAAGVVTFWVQRSAFRRHMSPAGLRVGARTAG